MEFLKKLRNFIKTHRRETIIISVILYFFFVGLVIPVTYLYNGEDLWKIYPPHYALPIFSVVLTVPLLFLNELTTETPRERDLLSFGVLSATLFPIGAYCAIDDPGLPVHHIVKAVALFVIVG